MKFVLHILFLTLMGSCGTTKDSQQPNESSMKEITAHLSSSTDQNAPISIQSIELKGNYLIAEVSYSGGCGEHTFECIGSYQISKSLPPRRAIEIIHINHEDMCKKLITEKIKIDLRELAYKREEGSEIYLDLLNWKEHIHYVYSSKN